MRADSPTRKLQKNNYNDFWKEVRVLNSSKTPLPSDIEGVCGQDKIDVWHEHYYNLFNCVKSNAVVIDNVDLTANMVVKSADVFAAIKLLDNNKA